MASLRTLSVDAQRRARRWDAIVLGSGVGALVAAARLGMRELRVLVVEEPAAATLPACMREPPLFAGARPGDTFETVLRELRVALIDRRRFVPQPLAYQVVGPDLRLDVGDPDRTANELVTWGLAKPDAAIALVDALDRAADIEREFLLGTPLVRASRLLGRARGTGGGPRPAEPRGLPRTVASVDEPLGRLLAAQVRGLGNHAAGGPSSEACARLLGAGLQGGLAVEDGAPGLIPTLRRRVEALYGEFRTVGDGFELINANGLPGVHDESSDELWLGRVLVVGCAPTPLARALGNEALARVLGARTAGAQRRLALHWRIARHVLPEGMHSPLILLTRPDAEDPQEGIVTVNVTAPTSGASQVDLVARTLLDDGDDPRSARQRIEASLLSLMPFSEGTLESCDHELPEWDDDDWLETRPLGREWPGQAHFRVGQRPPVYRLDRSAVAGLGLEGDLLLGWRAGDAIADEIT